MKCFSIRIKSKSFLIAFLVLLILYLVILEFISISSDNNLKVSDNAARVNFIRGLGLEVLETPLEEKITIIPETFNDVYQRYNTLQLSAGYDLTLYSGCSVKIYKYEVFLKNNDNAYLNLMIYNDSVIGGDISSPALDGFMLPLKELIN